MLSLAAPLLLAAALSQTAAAASAPEDFDALIALATQRTPEEAAPLMEAWVAAHPDDVRAARGLVWLARLELTAGHRERARSRLRRVTTDYPGTEWELHAQRALGDMGLRDHRYNEAVRAFDRLVESGQPLFAEPGRLLASLARAARMRWHSVLLLGGGLLLFLVWRLLRLGRTTFWPPPQELVSMLPILLLIGLSALLREASEARALWLLAGGASLVFWLNGAYLRARPPQGIRRFGHAFFGILQGAFLVYSAIVVSGLWDKMRDTLVMGGGE